MVPVKHPHNPDAKANPDRVCLCRKADGGRKRRHRHIQVYQRGPDSNGQTTAGSNSDAAAQDAFCATAVCVINVIYDQTGKDNHLLQGAPGRFKGQMKAGFDTQPIADMVPITISGHKAYGVYIIPGMAFRNTGAPVAGVDFALSLSDKRWTVVASDTGKAASGVSTTVAPGASVTATFKITSPATPSQSAMMATARSKAPTPSKTERVTTSGRVRSVFQVKINEVRLGTAGNPGDQFIELYNALPTPVDASNCSLVQTASQGDPVTLARIPAGTILASGAYYLLGSASTGLAAPASAGATEIKVASMSGLATGQRIDIDGESGTVVRVGTPAAPATTVFVPVSTGPWLTVPVASTNLPVTSVH